MNLLEHYIKEVHSVKDITNEYIQRVGYEPYEPLYKVDLTYDCYGIEERNERIFFKSDWDKSQEKGYFMA